MNILFLGKNLNIVTLILSFNVFKPSIHGNKKGWFSIIKNNGKKSCYFLSHAIHMKSINTDKVSILLSFQIVFFSSKSC